MNALFVSNCLDGRHFFLDYDHVGHVLVQSPGAGTFLFITAAAQESTEQLNLSLRSQIAFPLPPRTCSVCPEHVLCLTSTQIFIFSYKQMEKCEYGI